MEKNINKQTTKKNNQKKNHTEEEVKKREKDNKVEKDQNRFGTLLVGGKRKKCMGRSELLWDKNSYRGNQSKERV